MISRSSCIWLILLHTGRSTPCRRILKSIRIRTKSVGEAIRNARYERQKQLGIFPGMDDFLSERQFKDRWEDNAHAEWDARAMAVHAAMIDRMDQGIGQVIDALEKTASWIIH